MGVILRDFRSLTDHEVRDWGKKTKVILQYIKFERAEINLITEIFLVSPIVNRLALFQDEKGEQWPVEILFKQLVKSLNNQRQREGTVAQQFFSKNLYVGGLKIPEVFVRAVFRRFEVPVDLPVVQVYGGPDTNLDEKDMIIEKEATSDMGLYRTPSGSFMIADLSAVKAIDSAFFEAILFDLGENPPAMKGVGVVGQQEPSVSLLPFEVRVIPKNSGQYFDLTLGLKPIISEAQTSEERKGPEG